MNLARWSKWVSVGFLGLLVIASVYLAVHRIYQVDEAQHLFTARILGNGASAQYANPAPLFLLGPLAHMARDAVSSVALFTEGRLVFVGIFWVNILLISLNLTKHLRTRSGMAALLAAATLAPLWDYGFEVRHDNLVLTGLLLAWWMVRREAIWGAAATFGIGFLAVLLQFTAFKAFLFFLPLSAALLLFPPPGWSGKRIHQIAGWMGGGLLAIALARMAYAVSGTWEVYLESLRQGFAVSSQAERFPPWDTVMRLTRESPLVSGLALGGLIAWGNSFWVGWRKSLTWSGPLPELLMAMGVFGVLVLNPTPFPYNLVLVVPFFLLVLRIWWPALENAIEQGHSALPWVAGLIVVVHGLPFIAFTSRHFDWTNDRQQHLMKAAERLTDPATDPVYDGVGLLPTRNSIGYHWYLHSLNMKNFESGKWPSVLTMLEQHPAPVLIINYRTDWLPKQDRDYIAAHYVPLADDFWVLGGKLPAGGGEWTCLQAGRYVLRVNDRGVQRVPGLKVDGAEVGLEPMDLKVGIHHIESPPGSRAWAAWVGPREMVPPRLLPSDHRRLFVNWY